MLSPSFTEDIMCPENGQELNRELVELMRFILYYDGPLPSAANKTRMSAKHDIRKRLHPQLLQLFRDHPALPKLPAPLDWAGWGKWGWPQWGDPWSESSAVVK